MKTLENNDEYFHTFNDYHNLLIEEEKQRSYRAERFFTAIKKRISAYKFNLLLEFLKEDGYFEIVGIVRKHKVFGKKQTERYWFKHIYITQSCGYSGDDYSGTIFVPITEKHYLKFNFQC